MDDYIYYFAYIEDNTVIGGSWNEADVKDTPKSASWSINRWVESVDFSDQSIEELNVSDYKSEIQRIRKLIIKSLFNGWMTFF